MDRWGADGKMRFPDRRLGKVVGRDHGGNQVWPHLGAGNTARKVSPVQLEAVCFCWVCTLQSVNARSSSCTLA